MMKTLLLSATLASVAFTFATPTFAKSEPTSLQTIKEIVSGEQDKRKRNRGAWTYGKRSDTKRAYVTLAEGDSIDLFEG